MDTPSFTDEASLSQRMKIVGPEPALSLPKGRALVDGTYPHCYAPVESEARSVRKS